METINGEKVVTNSKTGAKLVLRSGKWVPYTPNGYQRFFAGPATSAAAWTLGQFDPRGIVNPNLPTPDWAKAAAGAIVPQTPTQAGIDVGTIAGGLVAPEAMLPAIATRMGAAALGGAAGSKLEGKSALAGAKSGAIQQGVGETIAPVASLAGRYSKQAVNQKDVERIGSWLTNAIPDLGELKTWTQFDSAFRGGRATRIVGNKLGRLEAAISKRLGKTPIMNLPAPLAMRTAGTIPSTVSGPASFDEVISHIRDLNRTGYVYAGDPVQKAMAADARREAHDLTEQLGQGLNALSGTIPGGKGKPIPANVGDRFLDMRRRFAKTSLLTRIFSEPELYDPRGKLDMSELGKLVQNTGAAGYREDLIRAFGPDGADEFLGKVSRGAPSTMRDVKGGLNLGISAHMGLPRIYAHPHIGNRIGEVPRRLPKVAPTAPALLLGQKINELLQNITGGAQQ